MGKVVGGTITTPINTYTKKQINNLVDGKLGDVETTLDNIIALQEQYIGYSVNSVSEGGDTE